MFQYTVEIDEMMETYEACNVRAVLDTLDAEYPDSEGRDTKWLREETEVGYRYTRYAVGIRFLEAQSLTVFESIDAYLNEAWNDEMSKLAVRTA